MAQRKFIITPLGIQDNPWDVVLDIVSDVCQQFQISTKDKLCKYINGNDDIAEIRRGIKKAYGIDVPEGFMTPDTTINEIADHINQNEIK